MLCQECDKKSSCTELCDEAEAYVSQDHVPQREMTYSPIPRGGAMNTDLDNINFHVNEREGRPGLRFQDFASFFTAEKLEFPFLAELENRLLYLFYFEGDSYAQIAQKVNLKVGKVRKRIHLAKRKIRNFSSKKGGNV